MYFHQSAPEDIVLSSNKPKSPVTKFFEHIFGKNESLAELKKTANLLAEENAQLESVLQSIQEGLIVTTDKNEIIFANRKALEILSLQLTNLLNQSILKFLPLGTMVNDILKEVHLTAETSMGRKIILEISSFPLLTSGEVRGKIYLLEDISRRGEFEKLKLDFVAQAAHQLRTPLSILKNYLYVFAKKVAPKLDQNEKLYLDRAMMGSEQLTTLIDNLLNVSRVENGKLMPQLETISMNEIVKDQVSRISGKAIQKDVKIQYPETAVVPPIKGDKYLIGEAIANLLGNAIDFSNRGGEVEVNLVKQPDSVIISITDHGVGIPSDAADKLFTKFYKVSGVFTQESQGLGLGLYNAKSIIDSHGGKIWFNSMVGKGSTFIFSLPL